MKAFRQVAYSSECDKAVQLFTDVEKPITCGPGEVLIRTLASGFNSGDVFMGRGGAKAVFNIPFPTTIGRDVAGVIEAVGEGVQAQTPLRVGDKVVGYVEVGGGKGTFAEYVVAPAANVLQLPPAASLSLAEAAALPTAGCTTWQALVASGVLYPQCGLRILILGGSSGTGHIALQLAKAMGCSEIATTSSQEDLCRSLGADTVVNHRNGEAWEEVLAGRDFDVIYDCVEGLSAWAKAPLVLRRSAGARFVTIVMDHPNDDPTIPSMLTFVGRMLYRKAWSLFGYPSFSWHINAGSVAGLSELLALARQGKLRVALDGPPRPATFEGFRDMWDRQMSGRAHSKLVMTWEQ
jgi:NADPH:quinone reductase-like Zn-dependent oxidoreductase